MTMASRRPLCVLLVIMVTYKMAAGFIPVRTLRGGQAEAVASPDRDIDELAMRREQLLSVQRARALARAQNADINAGSMQGRVFSPAYYRKLGRFPKPQDYNQDPAPYNPDNLRPQQLDTEPLREKESAPETLQVQREPELPSDNEVKQTTLTKESTHPVGEGEKVINVEKEPLEHVEQEGEEEKVPAGELHPTPAYRQAQDLNKLNPLQNAANMADVYFLDLRRDVKDPNRAETIQKRDGETSPAPSTETSKVAAQEQAHNQTPVEKDTALSNMLFIAVVAGCSVAGLVGLVVAGVCWYRLQKNVKAASEAEYPAYGITGPTKERVQSPGDRKLAQSAQMYHYQHQKQQMIALEKANSEMKQDGSDEDSEEENEEGDYTVYECPGLAPTGEMEVKNPLFSEDTPVTPTMPGNK